MLWIWKGDFSSSERTLQEQKMWERIGIYVTDGVIVKNASEVLYLLIAKTIKHEPLLFVNIVNNIYINNETDSIYWASKSNHEDGVHLGGMRKKHIRFDSISYFISDTFVPLPHLTQKCCSWSCSPRNPSIF